jgi:hypothetical protein
MNTAVVPRTRGKMTLAGEAANSAASTAPPVAIGAAEKFSAARRRAFR